MLSASAHRARPFVGDEHRVCFGSKIRAAWLAVPLLLACAPATKASEKCRSAPGTHVVQRAELALEHGIHLIVIAALTDDPESLDTRATRSEVLFCAEPANHTESIRFEAQDVAFKISKLDSHPTIDVATFAGGGSTAHRSHTLFRITDGTAFQALPTFDMQDQDGFFVGDLGSRIGDGVAFWGPDWDESLAHHAPRRYRVRYFTFVKGRLVLVRNSLTREKMMLGADDAAQVLHLPFQDEGPWRLDATGDWKKQSW